MHRIVIVALVAMSPALSAQQVETFCDPQERDDCLPDTFEIVFTETESSVFELSGSGVGVQIDCAVVTDTKSEPIRAFQYAVKHDENILALKSLTTADTIVDPSHPDTVFNGGFNDSKEVSGGWYSAIVLSFFEDVRLPVNQRNLIARARYEVIAAPGPEGTLIQFVDGELRRPDPGTPPIVLRWTLDSSVEMRPETLIHGLVRSGAPSPPFIRGDSNADGEVTLEDAIFTLDWWFVGTAAPDCVDAADADDNGAIEVSDAIRTLNHLFLGGPAPPSPWGDCGPDPTPDDLTCDSFAPCESTAPEIPGFTFIGDNAEGYPEYTHDPTGIVFVRLPGGAFNMGSPDDAPRHRGDEGPVHEVTLSPFLIAKYEVTQAQWEQVMGENPSWFDGTNDGDGNPVNPPVTRDTLPVESVSWDDIQEFETRTGLALPTEAQWEYACRGGTETAFSFGAGESCEDWLCAACPERDAYMWYCGNAEKRTHTVGTKPANPFGLHDMHGNVWEWCEDLYDGAFYSLAEAAGPDPVCSAGSEGRVRRGGCWYNFARNCRSAVRRRHDPAVRYNYLGLRPTRSSK